VIARRASVLVVLLALVLARQADAESAGWQLHIPERVELVSGQGGTLPIEIALDRGLSVSKDAAVIVDLTPDTAIAVKRRRLGRTDAVDPDAAAPRFAIAVRSDQAGDFRVRVRLRFWLCGQKVCKPVEARRNVSVSVTEPVAPAPVTP
jgi:hypothetical protein